MTDRDVKTRKLGVFRWEAAVRLTEHAWFVPHGKTRWTAIRNVRRWKVTR